MYINISYTYLVSVIMAYVVQDLSVYRGTAPTQETAAREIVQITFGPNPAT